MKKIMIISYIALFASMSGILPAQSPDARRAVFVESTNIFEENLKKRAGDKIEEKKPKIVMKVDATGLDLPTSPDEFKSAWHFPPVSQDLTGSCWAFSSISFFESEIHRLSGREIRLSEMYTVYWECVEKARRFVREKGESRFSRGSQGNATPRLWKQYGIVPMEAYDAPKGEHQCYDDRQMFHEMKAILETAKEHEAWDEESVIASIRAILDRHMGKPPETVTVNGKTMTPIEYLHDELRLNMDDYVDLMSLMKDPFYQRVKYDVPDNWWLSKTYLNVPLADFAGAIKKAAMNGYTVCIMGDNSEPGYLPDRNVALIAVFDIPSKDITDEARQLRFDTGSTSDDHAIQLVGYLERDDGLWYLMKDSGTDSHNGPHPGYMYYHEDFVKLKIMNIMLHRDMVKDLLEREAAKETKKQGQGVN